MCVRKTAHTEMIEYIKDHKHQTKTHDEKQNHHKIAPFLPLHHNTKQVRFSLQICHFPFRISLNIDIFKCM